MKDIFIKIISILIIILVLIGIKNYNTYFYRINNMSINKTNSKIELKETKTNTHIEKMSLYIDNTYKKDNKTNEYIKIANDNKYTIDISVINNFIQMTCSEDDKLDTFDYVDSMNSNNINNEIELIEYYINNKDNKLSMIDSSNKYKLLYLGEKVLQKLNINNNISISDNIIVNDTNYYIFNDNNLYIIKFSNNTNTNDINKIIESISFK